MAQGGGWGGGNNERRKPQLNVETAGGSGRRGDQLPAVRWGNTAAQDFKG